MEVLLSLMGVNGGYIFHDVNTQLGTLEDQLLCYFHNKNKQLQQDILSFLKNNLLIQERTRRFISSNTGESYTGRSQYYEKIYLRYVCTAAVFRC